MGSSSSRDRARRTVGSVTPLQSHVAPLTKSNAPSLAAQPGAGQSRRPLVQPACCSCCSAQPGSRCSGRPRSSRAPRQQEGVSRAPVSSDVNSTCRQPRHRYSTGLPGDVISAAPAPSSRRSVQTGQVCRGPVTCSISGDVFRDVLTIFDVAQCRICCVERAFSQIWQ